LTGRRERQPQTEMRFRTILLFGAPGSCKGTQGKILDVPAKPAS